MNIESAQYDDNGNITAVIDGKKWSGITSDSRFYSPIQDWVNEGNTISPAHTPSELTVIEKENNRKSLKKIKEDGLENIVHDFGDGRIVQVRPQDVANFQIAISLGVGQEWVMEDNTIATLTPTELQTALDSGIAQGKVIWQTYIDSLKLL